MNLLILLQMALAFISAGIVPSKLWRSPAIQIFTWLFLNSGVLFCMACFSSGIRGHIYDFSRTLSRPLPFRAFEMGEIL